MGRRILMMILISVLLASAWYAEGDVLSLKTLNVAGLEDPEIMLSYIADRQAAIQLGKALYWDMQVGSDGVTACATCHFHAGADNRSRNQISPGLLGGDSFFGNSPYLGTQNYPQFGPNYLLAAADFPLHDRLFQDSQAAAISRDTNDVVSSQGVHLKQFSAIAPGSAVDISTDIADPVFGLLGFNARRVEPRNTPSVINAVLFFDNFWDGRAKNIFNGQNPFGPLDPNARVFMDSGGALQSVAVRLRNSSLASQAVGPPLSDFEMSARGRTFPQLGRKMLSLVPLSGQIVHRDDSVLGVISNSLLRGVPAKGLAVTYEELIRRAFQPQWWSNATQTITFASQGNSVHEPDRQDPRNFVINNGEAVFKKSGSATLSAHEFSQMEANFALFFGLAIQLYESTLIADDSPFDRFAFGDNTAMTEQQQRGLNVFLGKGACDNCHGGVAMSNASIPNIMALEPPDPGENPLAGPIEFMNLNFGSAFYDDGFYNIGVRPMDEDIGRGGTAPTINPITGQPYPLSYSRLALLKRDGQLPPEVATFVPDLPAGTPNPPDRVAVDGSVKTPQLRNIELTGPYFRNGSASTLRQVVEFYSRGGNFPNENLVNLDDDIREIGFSESDKDELVAFMLALTDERVRREAAPFDHPQLFLHDGHAVSNSRVIDVIRELPATGRGGRFDEGQPFLQAFPVVSESMPIFSLSGRIIRSVTQRGIPSEIAGVTVTVSLEGAVVGVAVTDSAGRYSVPGLPNNASLTVTPQLTGLFFLPPWRLVNLAGANAGNVNFTDGGTAPTFSISGRVATSANPGPSVPVAGTTVSLSLGGVPAGSAVTDANGNYTVAGLQNGTYTVTPSNAGYTFSPVSSTVVVNNINVQNVNFTGTAVVVQTFSVSGRVVTSASRGGTGLPLSGVTMTVTSGGTTAGTAVTDGNGNYTVGNLGNGSYRITPTKAGSSFTPVFRDITINNANITGINFTSP